MVDEGGSGLKCYNDETWRDVRGSHSWAGRPVDGPELLWERMFACDGSHIHRRTPEDLSFSYVRLNHEV